VNQFICVTIIVSVTLTIALKGPGGQQISANLVWEQEAISIQVGSLLCTGFLPDCNVQMAANPDDRQPEKLEIWIPEDSDGATALETEKEWCQIYVHIQERWCRPNGWLVNGVADTDVSVTDMIKVAHMH
jgi:hypothetical protein